MFKKIISSILAVVMMAGIGTSVFADTQEDEFLQIGVEAEKLLSSYLQYEKPSELLNEYNLKAALPIYIFENNVLNEVTNVEFYPISTKIILIIFLR